MRAKNAKSAFDPFEHLNMKARRGGKGGGGGLLPDWLRYIHEVDQLRPIPPSHANDKRKRLGDLQNS